LSEKTCAETHLSIENGNTSCTESNLFESVCSYQCVAGYELTSGNASVTCGADQDWSAAEATCEKKICDSNSKDLIRVNINCFEARQSKPYFLVLCFVIWIAAIRGIRKPELLPHAGWVEEAVVHAALLRFAQVLWIDN